MSKLPSIILESIKWCQDHYACDQTLADELRCPWCRATETSDIEDCPFWVIRSQERAHNFGDDTEDDHYAQRQDAEVWFDTVVDAYAEAGIIDPLHADLIKAEEIANGEKKNKNRTG